MKIKITATCPGCKGTTALITRKPGVLDNAISQFRCSICDSQLLMRLQKPRFTYRQKEPDPDKQNAMVGMAVKVVKPSAKLVELLREEAQTRDEQERDKEVKLWRQSQKNDTGDLVSAENQSKEVQL